MDSERNFHFSLTVCWRMLYIWKNKKLSINKTILTWSYSAVLAFLFLNHLFLYKSSFAARSFNWYKATVDFHTIFTSQHKISLQKFSPSHMMPVSFSRQSCQESPWIIIASAIINVLCIISHKIQFVFPDI